MIELKTGQNWKDVFVVRTWNEGLQDGAVWDSQGGPLMAALRCGCGHDWEVNCDELLVKPKACGREECQYTQAAMKTGGLAVRRGRPKSPELAGHGGSVGVMMYVKLTTLVRIQQLAEERGVNRSAMVEVLFQKGFELMEMQGEI